MTYIINVLVHLIRLTLWSVLGMLAYTLRTLCGVCKPK